MQKFTTLTAVAAPLNMINVDTDMIIPKDYLKTIERTGLGKGLFSELRYNEDGSDNPDFVLNKPAYRKAEILVAGDFADIFYNNCFKNGILPITVSKDDLDKLMDDAERGANARISVDLAAQEVRGPDGGVIHFDIDPFKKHCLLNGLDDIGLTMEKSAHIAAHEKRMAEARPWI